MNGSQEFHERLATLEAQAKEIPVLREKVSNLERFQVMVMTGLAAVGGVLTFFADTIRKKIGW